MDGGGLATTVPLIIHVLDINDETPVFQDMPIQFVLTQDMRNFTERAFIKVSGFQIIFNETDRPFIYTYYIKHHSQFENLKQSKQFKWCILYSHL